MPRQKTREELEDRIEELEVDNETLQDQVDSIADIIEGEEEDEDEGED
jgi:chaperonin cofactor prefoldin